MRKPLVATVLVSAVAGAVIAGLVPVAAATTSDPDEAPHNRGWDSSSKNRGWDHDERAEHSQGGD